MQEFKKNLLDLVEQYGVACINVSDAERNQRRDMGKYLRVVCAQRDAIRQKITQQLDKITSLKSDPKFTYKASIYGPSFVIDQVDIEGNRETVVYLKKGMMFKQQDLEFFSNTGLHIAQIKNVRVFDCYEEEDFNQNLVENGKMWIVTDEYGKILKIVDLT